MMSRTMILGLAATCIAARKSTKTSVASIAATAGVSASTIHKFEQGKTWPRRVEAVVHAYAVTSGAEAHELWNEAASFMRE
jgi:AcrR family transcriptional regulator